MAVPDDYEGPTFAYDGERYPFDPARLKGSQVALMQSRTGYTYQQYIEGVGTGDAKAFGFYLWLSLGQPGKFSDFDYDYFDFIASFEGMEEDEADPYSAAEQGGATFEEELRKYGPLISYHCGIHPSWFMTADAYWFYLYRDFVQRIERQAKKGG